MIRFRGITGPEVASRLLVVGLLALGACKEEGQKPAEIKKPIKKVEPPKKVELTTIQVVEGCWKAASAGDAKALQGCYASSVDFTVLDFLGLDKVTGAGEVLKLYDAWRKAFPDINYEPQLILVDGRKVTSIVHAKGTHKGDLMGMAATNKNLSILLAQVAEFDEQGKIKVERRYIDQATFLSQLGVMEGQGVPTSEFPFPMKVKIDKPTPADVKQRNMKVITDGVDHLNNKDAKKLAESFAVNAKFRYVPEARPLRGRAGVEKRFVEYFGMNKTVVTKQREAWVAGDWGMIETVAEGETTRKFRKATGSKKGKWKVAYLEIFEFNNEGLIQNEWVFVNGLKFAADIGMFDPAQLTE